MCRYRFSITVLAITFFSDAGICQTAKDYIRIGSRLIAIENQVSIVPPSRYHTADQGLTGSISVLAPPGTSWTAQRAGTESWLAITSGFSGTGSGTVNYVLSENPLSTSRTAAITIAGLTFTAVQGGGSGSFAQSSGLADVILYQRSTGTATVLSSSGSGGFSTLSSAGWQANYDTVRLGDFNGDGNVDVLLYNKSLGSNTYVGWGNGQGSFTFTSLYWSPDYDFVIPADLNGDGCTDLILYNSGTGTVYYVLGSTSGTFSYVYGLWSPGYTQARVGDFDGDGKADMLLYRVSDATTFLLQGFNGSGFTSATWEWFSPGFDFIKVADINGDGKSDAIVYNSQTASAYTLIGDGAAGFTGSSLFLSRGYTQVALVDTNGDGFADLFVYNGNLQNSNAYLGLSQPSGGFVFGSGLNLSPGFDILEARDFDGHGRIGFILYNSASGNEYSLDSVAAGQFSPYVNFWGGGQTVDGVSGNSGSATVQSVVGRPETEAAKATGTAGSAAVAGTILSPIPTISFGSATAGAGSKSDSFTLVATASDVNNPVRWLQVFFTTKYPMNEVSQGCHIFYDHTSGRMWLDSTSGSNQWVGNTTAAIGQQLANESCQLDAAHSSVTQNGAQLTVTLAVSFKTPFTGYLHAIAGNDAGHTDWQYWRMWRH